MQVRVGLADALERDPVVGEARLGRDGPFTARHDVGPEAARGDLGDDRRDVVGLDRVLADPRIGESGPDGGGRLVERGEVRDVGRRPEASGRLAQGGRDRCCGAVRADRISRGRQAGRRC